MSKGDTFESDMLKLIFQAIAIANLADNAAASPLGSLYLSLHTADPGETGLQNTSETTYTGYARLPVTRSAVGWTLSGTSPTQVALAANQDFGPDTAGTGTITHFGVGVAVSGATKLLYSGPVTPNIVLNVGVTPRLTTGTIITED
jgi:hypothetical protein